MRKKFTMLFASLLCCMGVMKAQTATETLVASQILPSMGTPENQFYVVSTKSGGNYWNGTTVNTAQQEAAGKFAFYAVPGLTNCYYIYSINEGKWVNYNKTNRDNQKAFVQVNDNFDANAYWEIISSTKKNDQTACYQMRPTEHTTNQAGVLNIQSNRYANWFQGADNNSTLGLWQQSPVDDEGSAWSFVSVDVTGDLEVLLSQRIAVANEILASSAIYTKGDNLLTTDNVSSIVSSPFTSTQEGSIAKMVDGDVSKDGHWHSDYSGGGKINGSHYIVVNLGDATPELLSFSYTRRGGVANDHTTRWAVYGVPADEEGIEKTSRDGLTLLAMISTPFTSHSDSFNDLPFFNTKGFKKFRFYSEATNQNRGYFHIGEFQLNGNTIADSNEDRVKELAAAVATAEALETVTQADIDALNAKISLFVLSDEDRARGEELLALTGVGYPAENSAARVALRNAVESEATMLDELNEAIAAFKVSTEIALPENGKAYQLAFVANDANQTNYNVIASSTSLSVSSTDEATTFYCVKYTNIDGQERYAFVSEEGNFLAYHGLTDSYRTHVNADKRLQNDFTIASMVGVTSNVTDHAEERFGTVSLTVDNRLASHTDRKGALILKNSVANLPFDNTDAPYYDGTYTSAIKFTEVTDYEASNDVLVAASTVAPLIKGYIRVGEGIGKYAYTYGENTGRTFADFETLVNEATAVIADSDYSFAINMPATGFYRIKSMNGNDANKKGQYIQNSMSGNGIAIANTADANSIMYYNGSNILSYASGLYINKYDTSDAIGAVGTEPTTWNVMENAAVTGTYAMKHSVDGWYMSDWSSSTETTYGQNDANAAWIFEEVATLPVAVSAVGYATLYAPVALGVPAEGVTAHTVTIDGDKAILSEALEVIPAETGVILVGTKGTYNFTVTTTNETATSALAGTFAKTYVEGPAYVLSAPTVETVGLYKAKLNKNGEGNAVAEGETGTHFLNNAFKAYLPAPVGSEAPMFSFGRGEGTTGIDNAQLTIDNVVIYDLLGRRVEKMEKGIYIVNGKKVIK